MRKALLLFCLFGVTINAHAQLITQTSLFGKKWVEGRYYDLNGFQHIGLIAWVPPEAPKLFKGEGDHIFFKLNKDAEKEKIESTQIRSFVMGDDSLITSKNPSLVKSPFVKVLIDKNSTKLYGVLMTYTVSSGYGLTGGVHFYSSSIHIDYYYGTNGDDITELNRKKFIDAMSAIMADKPEVVAKIKDKTIRKGDLDDLLNLYLKGIPLPPPVNREPVDY